MSPSSHAQRAATALARLERAGLGPCRPPRGATPGRRRIRDQGEKILEALDVPPGSPSLSAAIAGALPELGDTALGRRGIDDFVSSVARCDAGLAGAASSQLTGLGPGQTPLGDDLLAGAAAAAVLHGPAVGLTPLRSAGLATALAPPRLARHTTPLSAALLGQARVGSLIRPLAYLLDLGADDPPVSVRVALACEVGSSSGRACALGIGVAALALATDRGAITTRRTTATRWIGGPA